VPHLTHNFYLNYLNMDTIKSMDTMNDVVSSFQVVKQLKEIQFETN
jgi:hypothetical protein